MKKIVAIVLAVALFAACTKDDAKPTACFTYINTNYANGPLPVKDCVIFENCSLNATSYLWDFGDGTTSVEPNPYHIYDENMPLVVTLTAFNGSETDKLTDTIFNWIIAYKPNIYIYPTENTALCVSLNFPKGGEVVTSIPNYANWCVNVEPSGKIDGAYDYLFYESAQPNIWQRNQGWCIPKPEAELFFKQNMQIYGFNQNEIQDFIIYWIPKLSDSDYLVIYPQNKTIINSVVELNFSIEPQHINRLFYVIEKTSVLKNISNPEVSTFVKTGFYINEWGVIL